MMQTFIVQKDKRIIRVYETSQGIEGVKASMNNEGVEGSINEVPTLFLGHPGQDIREFTIDWTLKPIRDRIEFMTLKEDETYDEVKDEIRTKNPREKIESGLEALEPDQKIVGDEVVKKTWPELVADNVKTYEEWLTNSVRPYRNWLLTETDTIYCNPERWWGYSDEQKKAWYVYKQALRDFPTMEIEVVSDVLTLPWPTRPE